MIVVAEGAKVSITVLLAFEKGIISFVDLQTNFLYDLAPALGKPEETRPFA